jgi:glycogen operon protein
MNDEDWTEGTTLAVGVFLNGQSIVQPDRFGRRVSDETFLVLFNASHDDLTWKLPGRRWGTGWTTEIDTAAPHARSRSVGAARSIERLAHSVLVLRQRSRHHSAAGMAP